jgi:hypothetical protein
MFKQSQFNVSESTRKEFYGLIEGLLLITLAIKFFPTSLNREHWKHVSEKVEIILREPFAKFVNSTYFFESELCGGAVTVSFLKYVLW